MDHLKNKIYGTIIGGVLGDILGLAQSQLEHRYGTIYIVKQPSDLKPLGIKPGCWSENTATFLALLTALHAKTNPLELYREVLYNGKYSSAQVYLELDTIDACNNTTTHQHTHNPCSLMRTCAVSLYYINSYEDLLREAHNNSMLTHKCLICADTCKLFSSIIDSALHGRTKKEILSLEYYSNLQLSVELWGMLTDLTFPVPDPELELHDVQHVLYLTLYYFKKYDNFKTGLTMILSANMLYKKYVCTLYGQLAGAYYGLTDIDESWLDDLDGTYFTDLSELCLSLCVSQSIKGTL